MQRKFSLDASVKRQKDLEIYDRDNNYWNNTQENIAKSWGEKSKVLRYLHDREERYNRRLYHAMGLTSIILSTVAGIGGFVDVDCGTDFAFVVGITGLSAAICAASIKFFSFDQKSELHKTASREYRAFVSEVEYTLSLRRSRRPKPEEWLKTAKEKFESLGRESPTISDEAIEKYKKKYGNRDIAQPDVANGIDRITVNTKDMSYNNYSNHIHITNEGVQEEYENEIRKKEEENDKAITKHQLERLNDMGISV